MFEIEHFHIHLENLRMLNSPSSKLASLKSELLRQRQKFFLEETVMTILSCFFFLKYNVWPQLATSVTESSSEKINQSNI